MITIKKTILVWVSSISILIARNTYTHNPIVLFDIHKVILAPDFYQARATIWNALTDGRIITQTVHNIAFWKTLFNWLTSSEAHRPNSEDFLRATQDSPALHSFIIDMGKAYKPIEGTVDIIQKLHTHGIALHLGSNISQTMFDQLIKHEQFSSIFNYFDIEKSKFINYTTSRIKKPDVRYFQEYLDTLRKQSQMDIAPHTIIFVDDLIENVYAARTIGMHAIHFTSPAQLQYDLEKILRTHFHQAVSIQGNKA